LNLFEPEIAPIDPPSPKTPPRIRHGVIGSPVAEIWPFAYIGPYWGHMEPPFWGKGRS